MLRNCKAEAKIIQKDTRESESCAISISDWIVILQDIMSTTKDIHIFFGTAIIAGIAVLIALNQIAQLNNPILNIILLTGVLLFFFIIMSNKNQKYSEPFRILYNDIIHGKENNLQNILRRYEEIEEEINKREKWRNNMRYRFLEYLSVIVGFIFIILGIFMYFLNGTNEWWNDRQLGLSFIPVGISIISIGIAIHSIILSKQSNDIASSSDKKMQSLTELNFIEKNAIIHGYVDILDAIKVGKPIPVTMSGFSITYPTSTSENKNISKDLLKRIIRDLDSACKVLDYITADTKEKFFKAFISLSTKIEDHITIFDTDDINEYQKIIEVAKKYKIEDKENVLERLNIKLNEKKSTKPIDKTIDPKK